MEQAGHLGVGAGAGAEFTLGDVGEALVEEEGRRAAGGEGEGARAELARGEEEDGAVDEVGVKEGGVERGAGFEEKAEALALGEEVEDGGEGEVAAGSGGKGEELDAAGRDGFEGCAAVLDGGIGEGGLGAEEEEIGLGALANGAEDLAGGRRAEMSVEDDTQEGATAGEAGTIGEGGVVGEDGADAGEDGVGGVAEAVDLGAGEWAGEPDGGGGGAGGG